MVENGSRHSSGSLELLSGGIIPPDAVGNEGHASFVARLPQALHPSQIGESRMAPIPQPSARKMTVGGSGGKGPGRGACGESGATSSDRNCLGSVWITPTGPPKKPELKPRRPAFGSPLRFGGPTRPATRVLDPYRGLPCFPGRTTRNPGSYQVICGRGRQENPDLSSRLARAWGLSPTWFHAPATGIDGLRSAAERALSNPHNLPGLASSNR